jgi:hypothetical protein
MEDKEMYVMMIIDVSVCVCVFNNAYAYIVLIRHLNVHETEGREGNIRRWANLEFICST